MQIQIHASIKYLKKIYIFCKALELKACTQF